MNNITIKVPHKAVAKVGHDALQALQKFDLQDGFFPQDPESGYYSFVEAGFTYDFLLSRMEPAQDRKRLFVLFSGAVQRGRMSLPVFQRWAWASFFPGHTLYVADPGLRLAPDLEIAWYAGTTKVEFMPTIARVILQVAESLGVEQSDIIGYGSSAGGFAALKMLRWLPEMTAVVINPQTDVEKFYSGPVGQFLVKCFGETDPEQLRRYYPGRLSVVSDADFILGRKIVYAQNKRDGFHYREHLLPLMRAGGLKVADHGRKNLNVFFFNYEGGHVAAEPKELFPELISAALMLSDI